MNDVKLEINKDDKKEKIYDEVKIDKNTYKLYGDYMPLKDEYIVKLSEYFGVSTDYLLGKSDIRNPEIEEDPLGLAKIGFSMKDYNPPTDKQREQLAELIKVVLKDNKKEDKEKNENNKG